MKARLTTGLRKPSSPRGRPAREIFPRTKLSTIQDAAVAGIAAVLKGKTEPGVLRQNDDVVGDQIPFAVAARDQTLHPAGKHIIVGVENAEERRGGGRERPVACAGRAEILPFHQNLETAAAVIRRPGGRCGQIGRGIVHDDDFAHMVLHKRGADSFGDGSCALRAAMTTQTAIGPKSCLIIRRDGDWRCAVPPPSSSSAPSARSSRAEGRIGKGPLHAAILRPTGAISSVAAHWRPDKA